MLKRIIGLVAVLMICGCQSQSAPSVRGGWVETQMFFGLSEPGRERISDAEWHDFVDRAITPRFPDGLTIVYGEGQFRTADGAIHKERSAILVLLHTSGDDAKLDEIAREYDRRFHQESVLRVDVAAKAGFISATTQP